MAFRWRDAVYITIVFLSSRLPNDYSSIIIQNCCNSNGFDLRGLFTILHCSPSEPLMVRVPCLYIPICELLCSSAATQGLNWVMVRVRI